MSHADEGREEFFHAEYPRLAGYCASLLGDPASGQDLASEALIRVLHCWGRLQDPRAYLYRVATNLVVEEHRRRSTRTRTLLRLQLRYREQVDAADGALLDLVDRLPERLRRPVLLHYYADLPLEQVARVLDRPAGTVRRWLAEARVLLRTQLEDCR